MTPKELKDYFKTGYRFWKETGFSAMSYSNWMKWGYIPIASQVEIQKITKGKLRASIEYDDITDQDDTK